MAKVDWSAWEATDEERSRVETPARRLPADWTVILGNALAGGFSTVVRDAAGVEQARMNLIEYKDFRTVAAFLERLTETLKVA